MSEEAPALSAQGVRKTFEAENAPVRALRGLDLTVPTGQFVALMGPSGCGKSTLLNLVAGLEVADEGRIFVAGEEVTGQAEDDLARLRRRHIGIVFQFFNLLEGMTVLENVALPAVIAGRKRRPAETRARDLLDLLGIGDKASTLPGALSGGQRQRLAIARALANEPTLLLADEPTGRSEERRARHPRRRCGRGRRTGRPHAGRSRRRSGRVDWRRAGERPRSRRLSGALRAWSGRSPGSPGTASPS